MSNPTELPDLDKLEVFWTDAKNTRQLPCTDPEQVLALIEACRHFKRHSEEALEREVARYAADTERNLAELDSFARRAQPEGEAPQAEPVAQFGEDSIFNLRKQPNGERWPVGTKLYVHPPAAQPEGGAQADFDTWFNGWVNPDLKALNRSIREHTAREAWNAALAAQHADGGALVAPVLTEAQRMEATERYGTGVLPWSCRIHPNQPLHIIADAMEAELNDLRPLVKAARAAQSQGAQAAPNEATVEAMNAILFSGRLVDTFMIHDLYRAAQQAAAPAGDKNG